jgi:membrane-associated phospholipid phosphatase
MNSFDKEILLWLNGYVGRWPSLDSALVYWQLNNLLCNMVLVAAICGFWFSAATDQRQQLENRQTVLATVCAMLIGIVLARVLAHALPFQARPIAVRELHFVPPNYDVVASLIPWSAFPSDHAVVWFALATGILLLHSSLGVVAMLYAAALSISRVYIGIHSPTDIVAGAAIGCLLTWALARPFIRTMLYASIGKLERRHPALFYGMAFVALCEMCNMFNDVREIAMQANRHFHFL